MPYYQASDPEYFWPEVSCTNDIRVQKDALKEIYNRMNNFIRSELHLTTLALGDSHRVAMSFGDDLDVALVLCRMVLFIGVNSKRKAEFITTVTSLADVGDQVAIMEAIEELSTQFKTEDSGCVESTCICMRVHSTLSCFPQTCQFSGGNEDQ
ncbi:hypothetical protein CPB85DRAFT_1341304 [Mucidula mucida]|nr:hypothetical protein CPB85DRAFT_1344329 [Mucidula mucida]KAF8880142.1 hypothetical protein CPB85DRAFT_1341304 [Mucidula mucida]